MKKNIFWKKIEKKNWKSVVKKTLIIFILKGYFNIFLRYFLQNYTVHSGEIYWILICRDQY